MFRNILVPTDGSVLSDKAVKQAALLALQSGAGLTLFHVAPAYPARTWSEGSSAIFVSRPKFELAARANAKKILAAAAKKIGPIGVSAQAAMAFSSSPYEAIIRAAGKSGCDLIVMASHGHRGIKGLVLGSETQKVLTHSRIPVLVIR